MSKLCSKYWVVRGNSLVRKIIRVCVPCRKYHSKPVEQIMSLLLSTRVTGDLPAFSHVGVDYFGPFCIVNWRKTEKKVWCYFFLYGK